MSERSHFDDLLTAFDFAMLVTQTPTGQLRARPMAIANYRGDGRLLFATGDYTGKIDELFQHPQVNVALQGSNRYLSVSGTAEVVRDRNLINEVWEPSWKIWFPQGQDDPALVLIRVNAAVGEYWDMSGGSSLEFVFEAGKALLRGDKIDESRLDHAKVRLD